MQIAFTCVVFPCLLLAYMGQAAYLMKNPDSAERIFYDSVPGNACSLTSSLIFYICNLLFLNLPPIFRCTYCLRYNLVNSY